MRDGSMKVTSRRAPWLHTGAGSTSDAVAFTPRLTPRIGCWCVAILVLALAACSKHDQAEVVLYTSCDDYLLREVIPAFEKQSDIKVLLVGDTEATKTTGLVQRLIAEKDHPRADVWWSNEPFGTMKLADEGLLKPFTPRELAEDFRGAWPSGLSAADRTWYGFALRTRALVCNTARVKPEDAPKGARELSDPKLNGRVGMARPQFGTTRGHIAFIFATCGEEAFRFWLTGLKGNGVRLYDGNSAVVRAVSQGEIDVGLTDTDDVVAGQAQKWPVGLILEAAPSRGGPCSPGPLPIPNTVGIIAGSPHPAAAQALADFLLSEQVERMLAKSESRNLPIRESLAREFAGKLPISTVQTVDWAAIHRAEPAAMKACSDILGD